MRPATLTAARSHLPATTRQLAARHGVGLAHAGAVIRELVRLGYAEEQGRELNDSGWLVPVYHSTQKEIAK
jgi:hypothetical protein